LLLVKNTQSDFELLFRRYRAGLVHFAMSIVNNRSDAEELVQDMFIAIWDRRDLLVFDDSLKNYLFTGVKNKCLNHIKKVRLPFADMPDEFPIASSDASAADHLQSRETEKSIHLLIARLPTKCRMVFLLSRMQELSYKEIAAVMDITPKTVENQIGIALKFLKDNLNKF
jgi:RNA polymerase sigma-70 factor (ECF subfamily)